MSICVPTKCANPECRKPTIKPIHRSSRPVAIDAVDGAPVLSHHITYRCQDCGHTWAVRGYTSDENLGLVDGTESSNPTRTNSRGW